MKRASTKMPSGQFPPATAAHFATAMTANVAEVSVEAPRTAPRKRALDGPRYAKDSCGQWSPVIPALESVIPQPH